MKNVYDVSKTATAFLNFGCQKYTGHGHRLEQSMHRRTNKQDTQRETRLTLHVYIASALTYIDAVLDKRLGIVESLKL